MRGIGSTTAFNWKDRAGACRGTVDRNQFVAGMLQRRGLSTLLIDLLTPEEELIDDRTSELRFNIELLAGRLATIVDWLRRQTGLQPDVTMKPVERRA